MCCHPVARFKVEEVDESIIGFPGPEIVGGTLITNNPRKWVVTIKGHCGICNTVKTLEVTGKMVHGELVITTEVI